MNFLTIPRWHDVLIAVSRANGRPCHCGRLIRRVKMSMTHLREILKLLKKHRLIVATPHKNHQKLALTEKGQRVSIALATIHEELYSAQRCFLE